MLVTVKLFATLSEYLPADARRNAMEVEVDDQATAADLLARCGLPERSVHLVFVNGVFVAPARRGETILQPGDVLAAWPPVAGG